MPTYNLSYVPLGGTEKDRTSRVVSAPTFPEACQKLPAYEWVRVSRPLSKKAATLAAYRDRIHK